MRYNYHPFKRLTWYGLLYLVSFLVSASLVAHSRKRVVIRRSTGEQKYDRSITTFDPTGRLLQVEYGMQAAERGEPIVALFLKNSVFILLKKTNNPGSSESSWSSSKAHRIDDHLWMFTAGLAGDARALASNLRSSCQQHRLAYAEPMTVKEAAQEAADLQHTLTRVGGARPLGCTAIVVGIDPVEDTGVCGGPSIFRTDPGGILEDCHFCCAGKCQGELMTALAERYLEFRDCSDHSDLISTFLETVTSVVQRNLLENEPSGYDLWVIRPNASRRGKTQATCFRSIVNPEGLQDVASYFDSES